MDNPFLNAVLCSSASSASVCGFGSFSVSRLNRIHSSHLHYDSVFGPSSAFWFRGTIGSGSSRGSRANGSRAASLRGRSHPFTAISPSEVASAAI